MGSIASLITASLICSSGSTVLQISLPQGPQIQVQQENSKPLLGTLFEQTGSGYFQRSKYQLSSAGEVIGQLTISKSRGGCGRGGCNDNYPMKIHASLDLAHGSTLLSCYEKSL